ncbi:hypothetical protein IPJ72_01775 [Candidatus Peregrinibacteria bacterium]|nr:MAG: hypothetical protein IPJ72_01775 [Candidatus Peregrinibacteria bacterium]
MTHSEAPAAEAAIPPVEHPAEGSKPTFESGQARAALQEDVNHSLAEKSKVVEAVSVILQDRPNLADFVMVLKSERFRGYRAWNENFKRAFLDDQIPLPEVMAYVMALQNALCAQGMNLEVDGKFGQKTLAALTSSIDLGPPHSIPQHPYDSNNPSDPDF